MSTLFVNNLNTASGSTITVPTGKTLVGTDEGSFRVPGTILQVVSNTTTVADGTTSTSSTSFVDINPLTTQITPKSSSSKILVRCILSYGAHDNDYNNEGRVLEDSTQVLRFHLRHEGGNANNVEETVGEILRSPNTTSQLTYKVQLKVEGSATVYLNRRRTDSTYTGQCTLTLMEIAQ